MTKSGIRKRTIVRTRLTGLRTGFAVAEHWAPAVGGRYAARRWLTVPSVPAAGPEPADGEEFALRVGGGLVRGTSYGTGPVVYLMRGVQLVDAVGNGDRRQGGPVGDQTGQVCARGVQFPVGGAQPGHRLPDRLVQGLER